MRHWQTVNSGTLLALELFRPLATMQTSGPSGVGPSFTQPPQVSFVQKSLKDFGTTDF